MYQLEYSYDGVVIGDLFPVSQGFKWAKQRNTPSPIEFQVSLRRLGKWASDLGFDVKQMFTPMRSSIRVLDGTNKVVGGWLCRRPAFTFGSMADATVNFSFISWLGLTAGAYLHPPLSYNDNFDDVVEAQMTLILERTFLAGRMWPITMGDNDTLAVVEDTLDAPKSFKDFLIERADNTEGTGTFDVYDDPDGVITLYERYGLDISSTAQFVYPDVGGKYGLKEVGFSEWDNYVSDIFLTGAGNGYSSTSGEEGAALFSEARNAATIANIGYWEHATSQSDISTQDVLDAKATSYVKDTDKPFDTPTLKIDGNPFNVYDHDQGGDLWLGDTIMVDVSGWAEPLIPLETPIALRINGLVGQVDTSGNLVLDLGMVADV